MASPKAKYLHFVVAIHLVTVGSESYIWIAGRRRGGQERQRRPFLSVLPWQAVGKRMGYVLEGKWCKTCGDTAIPTFYIFLSILNSPHEFFSQKCSTPWRNEVRRTTPPPYCSPATSCATPRPGRCKGVPLGVLTTCVVLPHKYRVFQTIRDKKGHQIALKHILIILAQSWH